MPTADSGSPISARRAATTWTAASSTTPGRTGSECREVIRGLTTPNGIGLSPDGGTLYVAETIPGRLWAWDLPEPGVARLDRSAGTMNRGRLVAAPGGYREFDSLAVDGAGNVCVATLHQGGITVAAPDGSSVEHVPLPDRITTNICFGGPRPVHRLGRP